MVASSPAGEANAGLFLTSSSPVGGAPEVEIPGPFAPRFQVRYVYTVRKVLEDFAVCDI